MASVTTICLLGLLLPRYSTTLPLLSPGLKTVVKGVDKWGSMSYFTSEGRDGWCPQLFLLWDTFMASLDIPPKTSNFSFLARRCSSCGLFPILPQILDSGSSQLASLLTFVLLNSRHSGCKICLLFLLPGQSLIFRLPGRFRDTRPLSGYLEASPLHLASSSLGGELSASAQKG